MLAPAIMRRLVGRFPSLHDAALLQAIATSGQAARLPVATGICNEGALCSHLALVLDGTARVYKLAEQGREITLYRVEPGECCILTASCILSGLEFPAFAISESELEAVLIPPARVVAWMDDHPQWRNLIWQLMASRLAGVISLVEEVAFRRVDRRLANYLIARSAQAGQSNLILTHHQIAADLGTSREVISRILKDMEQRGVLHTSRGHVSIDDSQTLIALFAGERD